MKFEEKNVKLYSRPRLNLKNILNINYSKNDNRLNEIVKKGKNKGGRQKTKKSLRVQKIIIVMCIAVITIIVIIKSINPIIDKLCIDTAKNTASKIANEEASNIMQKYTYEDLISITKDNNDNITMIQANVGTINNIASDIPIRIINQIESNDNSKIKIYLGSIVGLKILSGMGPQISAKIANTGNVETNLKSEFSAQGINQTLHRIYLEISLDVTILTPYNVVDTNIVNQVLIAESIIVGNVPSSYYNLNTNNSSDTIKSIGK